MAIRDHNAPMGRGFFTGSQFRTFLELNIAQSTSIWIRHRADSDFYLLLQQLVIDQGQIKMTVYNGATEATPFNTLLPVIGVNRIPDRPAPYHVASHILATGGTGTGGVVSEIARLTAATATAQQATVGGIVSLPRGLAPADYYVKLENIGNGAVTGVYTLYWEELLA